MSLLPASSFKQHSVVVYFLNYTDEELDKLHALDVKLDNAIREHRVGIYDWHEINMDGPDGTLYMYGPNAEELFRVVKPILEETDFVKGGIAVLHFGPGSDAPSIEVQLNR